MKYLFFLCTVTSAYSSFFAMEQHYNSIKHSHPLIPIKTSHNTSAPIAISKPDSNNDYLNHTPDWQLPLPHQGTRSTSSSLSPHNSPVAVCVTWCSINPLHRSQ